MENFTKTVRPGTVDVGGRIVPVYVTIKYEGGRLSITGIVGPRANGDAWGSCGQCVDELRNIIPAPGWNALMIKRLRATWERWHLNDMRPECPHQRVAHWLDIAGKTVTRYHWTMTAETRAARAAARAAAISALERGESFTPSKDQTDAATLDEWPETWTPNAPIGYEPMKSTSRGGTHTENKKIGWLTPGEHPDGILSRPCPTCGHKYGSAWLREEVPADVIAWLQSLPETDIPLPGSWGRP